MTLPIGDIVGAMADVAPSAGAAVLSRVELKLGTATVKPSDLIDLGLIGQSDVNDGRTQISVDAMSLLRSMLELSGGDLYKIELNASALGLAGTKVKLVGGQGEVHSPWMTVTSSKDVVIRTSAARLYVEQELGTGPLNLASIRFPIYAELASAEARLADIACTGDATSDGVNLNVTPSLGTLAIADVNKQAMNDLTKPLPLQPAALAYTPLAQISGFTKVELGGMAPQKVHFTKEDIDTGRVRSVTTNDLTSGVASSLMNNVQITASLLGSSLLGGAISLAPLSSAVGSKLNVAAPALDGLINELTAVLGVRLGVADVRVDRMRCGVPTLVS